MKIPIIPVVIATVLAGAAVYLYTASPATKMVLGVPHITRLTDFNGTESEAAIAPDGVQCAVVVSGDLWLLNMNDGSRRQLTKTPEAESFPSWTPDGRLAFARNGNTFSVKLDDTSSEQLVKPNATFVSWSASGGMAFIRDRALWIAAADGSQERRLVDTDANPDVTFRVPRFSPDSARIAFIKSLSGFHGELWLVTVASGQQRPLVADRAAENPMDVGWIMDGRDIVYLTNRSGAYTLWHIDLADNTILPLTVTLDATPLAPLGITISKDRILIPRHFVDSDIVLSDGATVAATPDIEFEPAFSPDGKSIAYTIQKDTRFEIWTAGIHGENPVFRALGREPRFSPSGFQIVYTNTDPSGNEDVWKLDLRNSATESLTDAQEIDLQPDWSHDGRSIVFASARGGPLSLWTIPADGGKRLRLNDGGAYPRFSPKEQSILFWNQNAFWAMDADGSHAHVIRNGIPTPAPVIWTPRGPKYYADAEVNGGRQIWPTFDVLPDGRFVIAPIHIRETSLWAIDLTYEKKQKRNSEQIIISPSMTLPEISNTLARLGADFHRRDWVLGTSGNFSSVITQDPLRLAITASSVDKGRLTTKEILEVDQDARILNGAAGRPSAETLLHIAVVQTTGAEAVLHTHSVWSTVLSDVYSSESGFFIEGYEMLKGLEGVTTHEHREWLPILENSQDMEALSARARLLMRGNPGLHGFLIRRHGLYTWGKDLDSAARHVEIFEFLMESVGRRRSF